MHGRQPETYKSVLAHVGCNRKRPVRIQAHQDRAGYRRHYGGDHRGTFRDSRRLQNRGIDREPRLTRPDLRRFENITALRAVRCRIYY